MTQLDKSCLVCRSRLRKRDRMQPFRAARVGLNWADCCGKRSEIKLVCIIEQCETNSYYLHHNSRFRTMIEPDLRHSSVSVMPVMGIGDGVRAPCAQACRSTTIMTCVRLANIPSTLQPVTFGAAYRSNISDRHSP